jgi:hypothetical protein
MRAAVGRPQVAIRDFPQQLAQPLDLGATQTCRLREVVRDTVGAFQFFFEPLDLARCRSTVCDSVSVTTMSFIAYRLINLSPHIRCPRIRRHTAVSNPP